MVCPFLTHIVDWT